MSQQNNISMLFDPTFNVSNLDGSNGFILNGLSRTDELGAAVSAAGDINGDGLDDILISAPEADRDSGESYIIFGTPNLGNGGTFDLASLNGRNGFVINGIDGNDRSGFSVSTAGDINGDGFDDLILGAQGGDGINNDTSNAGESYVIFGGNRVGSGGVVQLTGLNGNNGFVINGMDLGDRAGTSVSSAGDVNDDGFDDLIIGAPQADPNGISSGEAYIVFGGPRAGNSGNIDLADLNGTNGFVITTGVSAARNALGTTVSSAGDLNGDGVDDLLIGAPDVDINGTANVGSSYVVFGNSTLGDDGSFELNDLDGSNGFVINGIAFGDNLGSALSNIGDINNDGIDDIVVAAASANANGRTNVGQSYVIFGDTTGFAGSLNVNTLDGSNGFVINGIDSSDLTGADVSGAGDLNGDGIDDLVIASVRGDGGASYVIFGDDNIGVGASLNVADLNGDNGFAIAETTSANAFFSNERSVSNLGDVNGDGIDDLIVGNGLARNADNDASAGQGYVIFGRSRGRAIINGTSNSDILTGTNRGELITGRGSADIITTGGGRDTVRYRSISDGLDVITDFTVGVDQISLDLPFDRAGLNFNTAMSGGYLTLQSLGDATVIRVDLDGSARTTNQLVSLVVVEGVSRSALNNANNFVL